MNKGNTIKQLTQQQVIDLYTGRSHTFANGQLVLKMDAPADTPLRAKFYHNLIGQTPSQVNAHWARLMFAGNAVPPTPVYNNDEMVELVSNNPNTIGYIQEGDENDRIKTVFVIPLDD